MIAHPVEILFDLFLTEWSEYNCSQRSRQQHEVFYFEMSAETFNGLLKIPLNSSIKGTPLILTTWCSHKIGNRRVLGTIVLDSLYYVPIAKEDGLPKGKAVIRKKVYTKTAPIDSRI
jgi:hypothetical protein